MRVIKLKKSLNDKKKPFLGIIFFSFIFGIYVGNIDVINFVKSHYYLLRSPQIISSFFEKNDLEILTLNISHKNLQIIKNKREIALKKGLLQRSSDDFVSASITCNGIESPCKIRLKGDLADHWQSDKWSLRIKIKDNQTLLGMSEFSLQNPVVRGNTQEWLFLKTIESQNLLGVDYRFVNLVINGKKMGIYALEEHFTKHLLERCKRREGAIFGFDDSALNKIFFGDTRNLDTNQMFSNLPIKFYNRKIDGKKELSSQYNAATGLIMDLQNGKIPSEKVFNPENLGKYIALCSIWGTEHNFQVNNIKFYFNPILAQLEPIAFDGCPSMSVQSPYQYFSENVPEHSFWLNYALKSPDISYYFVKYLDLYSRKSFIDTLRESLTNDEIKHRRLLLWDLFFRPAEQIFSQFSTLLFRDQWQILDERCARIRKELDSQNPVMVTNAFNDNSATISIINVALQPIEIIGFEVNDSLLVAAECYQAAKDENFLRITDKGAIVLPSRPENSNQHKLTLKINNLANPKDISVKVRIWGLDTDPISILIQPRKFIDLKLLPNFAQSNTRLTEFDFISEKKDQFFIIGNGNYKVNSDIVIPSNATLVVQPNTTLQFAQNACLICFGSIVVDGNSSNPVIFTDQTDGWGGAFVHNPRKPSNFKFCVFENINGVGYTSNPFGIERSGWNLTGAFSSYESEVKFENCVFTNINSEDALNIFGGRFELIDSNFSNTFSDAFDGDFASGKIEKCNFFNIGGDGVDFSGSESDISECTFSDIVDKAISVGEKSHIKADSIYVENVAFGVVSKDQSVAKLNDSTIRNASISAVSAYQKKPEFGPAEIYFNNSNFMDCSKDFLIQVKSLGMHDEKKMQTEVFNSDSLYKN
tara:strand:+ start:3773 stop:6391 length:2619 start_codon:yes stop_codon:yes gene_type:complete